jgi:type I restriction enzyme S subunit
MSVDTDTLESMCDLIVDCPHSTPKWTDEGIIVLRNQNIKNGTLNLSSPSYTNDEDYEKRVKRAIPQAGDIVFTREAPMGEVCMIPEGLKCCLGQRQVLLRPKNNVCGEYLFWSLQSPFVQHQISWNEGTGSTVSNVRIPVLKAINIPRHPDKEEEIANVLSSLANKIELNRQTNQTLEQIAQAIFKSWFVDFDPVKAKIQAKQNGQDPERAAMCAISGKSLEELELLSPETQQQLKTTAAIFPDVLVESEWGEIPEGWEVKKLKEICRVINGRAYKNTEFKEEGIPIVRIQNLSKRGKTVFSDLELPEDKLIDKEDFIYAWSATFGPHIWRGPKSIYHYHIWKMDVNEKVISRYFLYLSMFRKTEQMKSAGTGSIFTHLTKAIMESQEILIGTPELNKLFKNLLDTYFKKITMLRDEVESLERIRDTLLPKLLSGELSIDPAHEDLEVSV